MISFACEKADTFRTEDMHPQLNFVFSQYRKLIQREIPALISPKIETAIKPVKLHPFIRSIFWRKYQEDKERKQEKEKKTSPLTA